MGASPAPDADTARQKGGGGGEKVASENPSPPPLLPLLVGDVIAVTHRLRGVGGEL